MSARAPATEFASLRRIEHVVAGGDGDEVTDRANAAAVARSGLVPCVLRGGRGRELGAILPGRRVALPVIIAPEMLPSISGAVEGTAPLLLGGGVYRGTAVAVAPAIGPDVAAISRQGPRGPGGAQQGRRRAGA